MYITWLTMVCICSYMGDVLTKTAENRGSLLGLALAEDCEGAIGHEANILRIGFK